MNRLLRFLLIVGSFSLAGCQRGEVLAPVVGTVTCEGQPVPQATLLFHNDAKGVHMTAVADAQGKFKVLMRNGDGLPLGDYDVEVVPPMQDHPLGPIKAPPPGVDPYVDTIPVKYRSRKTSDLKLSVTEKTNNLDVDMKRN